MQLREAPRCHVRISIRIFLHGWWKRIEGARIKVKSIMFDFATAVSAAGTVIAKMKLWLCTDRFESWYTSLLRAFAPRPYTVSVGKATTSPSARNSAGIWEKSQMWVNTALIFTIRSDKIDIEKAGTKQGSKVWWRESESIQNKKTNKAYLFSTNLEKRVKHCDILFRLLKDIFRNVDEGSGSADGASVLVYPEWDMRLWQHHIKQEGDPLIGDKSCCTCTHQCRSILQRIRVHCHGCRPGTLSRWVIGLLQASTRATLGGEGEVSVKHW